MKASHKRGLGAVLSLVATASLIAVADGGQSPMTTFTATAGSIGAGKTTCPHGRGLLSQGFSAPGFGIEDGATAVRFESRRSGTRTVKTSAFNFGMLDGTVRINAYCSRAARRIEVVGDRVDVAKPLAAVVARPQCPAGSRAVGGGFAAPGFAPGSSQVVTFTSRRAGARTWRVEAVNIPGDGGSPRAGKLVGYAYCLDDPPSLETVSTTRDVDQTGLKRVVARCPQGSTAISGGFDGNVRIAEDVSVGAAINSKRMGRAAGWAVKGLAAGAPTAELTVYAYCATT